MDLTDHKVKILNLKSKPIPKAASQNPEADKNIWAERKKIKPQWELEGSSNSEANSEPIKAQWCKLFLERKVLPNPFRAGGCTKDVTSTQARICPSSN